MSYHNQIMEAGSGQQAASDEGKNGTYTFMVTTFTVPGAGSRAAERRTEMFYQPYDELIAPISGTYGGAEVNVRAGRTVSCFKNAQDALRAAVQVQSAVDEKNLSGSSEMPVLARIALHTGEGFVDPFEQLWEGVAVALRCASMAKGGEVLLTDVTLDSLEDHDRLHCQERETVTAEEHDDRTYTVHSMVWNPAEREVSFSTHPNH